MSKLIPQTVNYVGDQLFIEEWVNNPKNGGMLAQYDLSKTILYLADKFEQMQAMSEEDAKEVVASAILKDLCSELNIHDIETFEMFLQKICENDSALLRSDDETDIEKSIQELSKYLPFEVLEAHELDGLTQEEALTENALGIAEENTEEEEAEEEEAEEEQDPSDEYQAILDEVEWVTLKDNRPLKEEAEEEETEEEALEVTVKNMDEDILSFGGGTAPTIELVTSSGVPWDFLAKFWNEDVDLMKLVKDEKVAQYLLERVKELVAEDVINTKREFIDSLFLTLNGYPPAVAELIGIFDELQ